MPINVIVFGQLADITGASLLLFEEVADTDTLQKILLKENPLLANVKYAIAVDKITITENKLLSDNATVALLPPFSGG